MKYLKIENPGIAPMECFTLLGCSTSQGNAAAIGQYGTGVKHAINMFLHLGSKFYIYCGSQCLDFFTETKEITDGIDTINVDVVNVKVSQSGKSTKTMNLGWTLNFGRLDWTQVSMACREFVSNAIDRCVKENKMKELDICIVEENQIRAKNGTTRIFLPLYETVEQFYRELHKRFICLKPNTPVGVMDKTFRNLNGSGAMVYRKGVLVKETRGEASLFDYNIPDLFIDECRNSNDFDISISVTKNLFLNSTLEQKRKLLFQTFNTEAIPAWEQTLSSSVWSYVTSELTLEQIDKARQEWKKAWEIIPSELLLTDSQINPSILSRKNLTAVVSKCPLWYRIWKEIGMPVADNVLNVDEKKGIVFSEPNDSTLQCLDTVWDFILTKLPYIRGTDKPNVVIFEQLDETRLGYYVPGSSTIHIAKQMEVEGNGTNRSLKSVILEECLHYATGYDDFTRELQNLLFNLIAENI